MRNVLGREDLSWEGKGLLNRILQSFQGCNRNTWEWDIHQELSGMLILAELSAGGPNTHLFGLVQYVSYCLLAQRLKLWWFKPGRACLNRRDQVSGVLVWGNRWEQEYQLAACWIFRFLVGDVLVSERCNMAMVWKWLLPTNLWRCLRKGQKVWPWQREKENGVVWLERLLRTYFSSWKGQVAQSQR